MNINMEFIDKYLSNNKISANDTTPFTAFIMPSAITQAFLGMAISIIETTRYIIYCEQNNIFMIPCDKVTNEPNIDKKVTLNILEITNVSIKNEMGLYIVASFFKNNDLIFKLRIEKTAFLDDKFYKNFVTFINKFENEGLDIVPQIYDKQKNIPIIFPIAFLGLFLIFGIYLILYDNFIYGTIAIVTSIYLTYNLIKNIKYYSKRKNK